MAFTRTASIIVLAVFVTVFSACVEDKDYGEANNMRPEVNRNVDVDSAANTNEEDGVRLDSLIVLPYEPVESAFQIENIEKAGGTKAGAEPKERLIVVLRFSTDDTEALMSKLSGSKPPFENAISAEPWFPAELKAKSDTAGDQQLKGSGYGANDFVKSPWLNGSLTRINGTEYFVLVLQKSLS